MTKLLRYTSAGASVAAAIEALRLRRRFHTDLEEARQALRAVNGKVVSTSFGDVEYAELGAGEPVLVVHGIFGGRDQAASPSSRWST